jgi:ABC-type Zn uptake system ZnuABC Zn-binding protein ZnuA
MKAQGVKLILVEPYFDTKTPESVARETGARLVVLLPSVGGEKGVDDYIELFDYNLERLVAAIKQAGAR